jgi:short-subunit dehydrogenase
MNRQRTGEAALVTGASAGIGQEIARELATRGYDVALVARSGDKLERLAEELSRHGVRTLAIAIDLAMENGPAEVRRCIDEAGWTIDLLVNNAGVGHFATFAETPLEHHLQVVRLNVVALTAMTSLFLPGMKARGRGRILNLASVAAFQPVPMLALYGATKAFLLSLTEALSSELYGSGVTATAVCPGFTSTAMVEQLQAEAGDGDLVPGFLMLDPAVVAKEAVDACLAGTTVHVNGLSYRAAVWLGSWQPRWVLRGLGTVAARVLQGRGG